MRKIPLLLLIACVAFCFGVPRKSQETSKPITGDDSSESSRTLQTDDDGASMDTRMAYKSVGFNTPLEGDKDAVEAIGKLEILMESVDNYYNLIIEDEQFCVCPATLKEAEAECYPYQEMHARFDELDKELILTEEEKKKLAEEQSKLTLPEENNQESGASNNANVQEEDKPKKIKVKHEMLATTAACSGENIEIIQAMHARCDRIEHLTINGNGPIHSWPLDLLYRLFKFEIGEECVAFINKIFPIQLNLASISYNDVIINAKKENISPENIRELLRRCRRVEAFCRSQNTDIIEKVCEATLADQQWIEDFRKVAVVVHQGMEITFDLQKKSFKIKVSNGSKLPNIAYDWIYFIALSKEMIDHKQAILLFENFAETLEVIDFSLLKVEEKDMFSLTVEYFEDDKRLDNLILLILPTKYKNIDSYTANSVQGKMETLIGSMNKIAVIALTKKGVNVQWPEYCPLGWTSFDNTRVFGCYHKDRIRGYLFPAWLQKAISQPTIM